MLMASMCPSWHLVGSNISSDKRLGFPGLPPQWEVEQRMRERNFDVLCTYAEVCYLAGYAAGVAPSPAASLMPAEVPLSHAYCKTASQSGLSNDIGVIRRKPCCCVACSWPTNSVSIRSPPGPGVCALCEWQDRVVSCRIVAACRHSLADALAGMGSCGHRTMHCFPPFFPTPVLQQAAGSGQL